MFKALLGLLPALVLGLSPGAKAAEDLLPADRALEMAREGKITLIDVRTPQEWRESGIPEGAGRVNIQAARSAEDFATAVAAVVGGDRTKPVAVICRSGNRSAMARQALLSAGFTQVYDIGEGMSGGPRGPGWLRRGLPVAPCPTC
jgi:rhodanese-related sulfurtransferase